MYNASASYPRFGDIMYADLPYEGSVQGGLRPVLIVQNNKGNQYSSTVEVLPLSSRIKKGAHLPTHVLVDPDENNGLIRASIVLAENVLTIPMNRLKGKVGFCGDETLLRIGVARRIQSPLPF